MTQPQTANKPPGKRVHQTLPRTLLINGTKLGSTDASGHLFTNLFEGWPTGSIAQISHVRHGRHEAGADWNAWYAPNAVGQANGGWRVGSSQTQPTLPTTSGPSTSGLSARLKQTALPWLELLPIPVSAALARNIDIFQPEVIYTWLGSPAIHQLVRRISSRWHLPVVVHIMDDWVSCKYGDSWLTRPCRLALTRGFKRSVHEATARIAISDRMAAEYSKRYDRDFEVISNCVDLAEFPLKDRRPPEEAGHRDLVLAHFGRIDRDRATGLADVERALKRLAREGVRPRIELVGIDKEHLPESLRSSSFITCRAEASNADLSELATEVDAFLQLESFDAGLNEWFSLSLSAKLPVYAALGRPILAYGPAHLGSIDYVSSNGCGTTVTTRNDDELIAALRALHNEKDLVASYSSRARSIALHNHDRAAVRERLRKILTQAAETKRGD